MKESPEVMALIKAKVRLENELDKISNEGLALKAQYDIKVQSAVALRSRIAIVEQSLKALSGDTTPETDDLTAAIEGILRVNPLTLAALKTRIGALGFAPGAVRKALNGIAFTHLAGPKGQPLYALREAIYATKE